MPAKANRLAFKVALIYIIVAGAYILLSNELVKKLVSDPDLRINITILKGWIFVLVTGGLLYGVLRRLLGRWEREVAQRSAAEAASHAAVAKLRASEEQLRLVLDASADGLWDLNCQTGIAELSPRYWEITGYTPGEVAADLKFFQRLVHPDDWPGVTARRDEHLAGNTDQNIGEYRLVTKDGAVKWIWGRGKVVARGADGTPRRMAGTITDITERKQALESLRQTNERVGHLNHVLLAIQEVSHLLSRERDPGLLLHAVCDSLVKTRGYVFVWVGQPEAESNRVLPVAHSHGNTNFLQHAPITWDDSPLGQGPTGTAIRERRAVVFNDLASDPRFAPWRDSVVASGGAAIAAIPLLHGERIFAALTIKADHPNAFDDEEVALLSSLAADVARALHNFEEETARRNAEGALAQSYSLLNAALESTADGILVADGRGKITSFNRRFLELWRIPPELAADRDDHKLMQYVLDQLQEPAAFVAKIEELYHSPEASSRDELKFRDGRVFERYSQAQRLGDQVVGRVWSFRDATERRLAERKLRESQERYALAERATQDGLWDWNILTNEDYFSPRWKEIIGYRDDEIVNQRSTFLDLLHPDDQAVVKEVTRGQLEKGERYAVEFRLRHKDGSYRWLLSRAEAVRDAAGRPVRLVGAVTDITGRKAMEAELRRANHWLLNTQRISKVGGWAINPKTGEVWVSPEACRIYGVSEKKPFTLAEIKSFPLPQYRAGLDQAFAAVIAGQSPYNVEFKIARNHDGAILDIHSVAEYNADEAVVQGVIEDITERKHKELELQRSERALKTISACDQAMVRAATEAELLQQVCRVMVETGGYRMTWVGFAENDEAKTVRVAATAGHEAGYLAEVKISWSENVASGRGPTGVAIRTGQTVICQDTQTDPLFTPWREAARQRGYASSISLPLRHAEKTFGIVMIYAAEPKAFQPAEVALLTTMSDDLAYGMHTMRMRLQNQRMEESHTRLATAIEQAAETVVITDTNGTILYANPAFEKNTGYTGAEALGRNPRMLKSGKHDADFYRQMWATLQRGEVWIGHFINRRKDGALIEEDATVSPIRDADGAIISYVAVKRNVTHEVQLETQIRQSQKMEAIGTLAGGIAHDFNNMLAAIFGYAHLLQQDTEGNPLAQESVEEILKSANRAKELVQQILTFSRPRESSRQVIRLDAIIKEAMKFLRASLPANLKIEMRIESGTPAVLADATQIYQVTMNLATNALHAMEGRNGQLTVILEPFQPDEAFLQTHPQLRPVLYARLTIADTGCGMDTTTLERIYEPFFTTKPVGKGTGLGLSVVHGIVKSHEGVITAASQVGQGTTFRLYFPAQPQAETVTADAGTVRHAHGRGQSILFLDDEVALTSVVQMMLRRLDYQVTTSNHGSEALRLVRANPAQFDLVITDLTMPEINGLEVARQLHAIRPELPVILMSGFDVAVDAASLRETGIREQLQKPVSMSTLSAVLQRVLKKS